MYVDLSFPAFSRCDPAPAPSPCGLFLQTDRLCLLVNISSLVVTSPRKRTSVNIVPNAYPTTKITAQRTLGDTSPIEFVQVGLRRFPSPISLRPLFAAPDPPQDPDPSNPSGAPSFLIKLSNDDELIFSFTFVMRQSQGQPDTNPGPVDTSISGLTYVNASNPREVENLVTREFHADPNLHKNANVALVGDYSTGGSPSVTFEWTWKWKPPKPTEDRGGGWRNSCSVLFSFLLLDECILT